MTAWIIAVAVLAVALILYNFVDVPKDGYIPAPPDGDVTVGNQVGDTAPDFTIRLYGTGSALASEFSIYSLLASSTTPPSPCAILTIPFSTDRAIPRPILPFAYTALTESSLICMITGVKLP